MQLFVISYKAGAKGCPVLLKGVLNHDWTWDEFDPDPDKFNITLNYEYRSKNPLIDFDFWNDFRIGSDAFCELCDSFGTYVRRVPQKIIQSNGKPTVKKYNYLLWRDWLSIIDTEKSDYEISRDPRTGEIEYDKYFSEIPFYEEITRFIPNLDKIGKKSVFKCVDIHCEVVCTETFRDACIERGFLGLDFIPIEEFKMIPPWKR